MIKLCQINNLIFYIGFIYVLASIIYLVWTQYTGTPLKDALRDHPKLLKIKIDSANERRKIFYISFAISTLIVCIFRIMPITKC